MAAFIVDYKNQVYENRFMTTRIMKIRFMKPKVHETQVCKIVLWEQEQTSNPALRAS
jgi:hypothetical protein